MSFHKSPYTFYLKFLPGKYHHSAVWPDKWPKGIHMVIDLNQWRIPYAIEIIW